MSNELAVGIDLGTTYSVLARLDETGRPATIVNAEGERTTPSVVLFEEDQVIVGKEALKAMATEADHVAECAKREVGHRVFHKNHRWETLPAGGDSGVDSQQAPCRRDVAIG